jgi:hypothetical protein
MTRVLRWPAVVQAVRARVVADPAFLAAVGGAYLYKAAANVEYRVPSVDYTRISTVETENTVRVLLQFDVWARSTAEAAAIETALHGCLHRVLPETLAGLPIWLRYSDSRDHAAPRPGVEHSSADYVFTTHL